MVSLHPRLKLFIISTTTQLKQCWTFDMFRKVRRRRWSQRKSERDGEKERKTKRE